MTLACFVAAACTETTGEPDPDSDRPPNILVIMTDDQPTKDTLSVMPHTRRWFVDGGTNFTNAFATTPLCCPSRATFFSGRYVHNHNVIRSTPGYAQKLEQDSTIQRYLGDEGYLRGVYGKYLNGWDLRDDPPHFDDWVINEGGKPLGYYNGPWNINGERKKIATYSTTFIKDHALRFLDRTERNDDQPWIMFVHPYAPHTPFSLPKEGVDVELPDWEPDESVGEKDVSDKPPFARRIKNPAKYGAKLREKQLRALVPVDDLVNEVMTKLQDLGEDETTLAFYSSDNGYLWGEHQLERKSEPYNAAVNIPLLMRWPGRVEAGKIDESIVANMDVAPTIYDAVGVEPDERWPVDGTSLIRNEGKREDILLEYWQELPGNDAYVSWAAVRTNDLLYVEYYEKDLSTVRFREYYDLRNDPSEMDNLLGDDDTSNDPELAEIQARLEELRRCEGASCR